MKSIFPIILILISSIHAFQTLTLSGGILQKQYKADIFLGTPPQPFRVQVDTGSGKLGVNCKGCPNCQNHPNPPFDSSQSSSSSNITCADNIPQCQNCGLNSSPSDNCQYFSEYYDRSWISGNIIEDVLSLNGGQGVRSKIGCVTNRSNQFVNDVTTDGIWGIGRSEYYGGQYVRTDAALTALSNQFGVAKTYSLCLSYQGGKMVIGGVDTSLHTQNAVTLNYNDPSKDVKVGQTVINYNAGAVMHDLIIDSGSSGSLLDTATFSQVTQKISEVCTSLGQQCWVDPDSNSKCIEVDSHELLANFPAISFTFSGQEVLWYPDEYLALQDTEYPNYFCFGADVPPEGSSYVLGARFMINKDIVFGQANMFIYPDSNCGGKDLNQVISELLLKLQSGIKSKRQEYNKAKFWVVLGGVTAALVVLAILMYCYWKKKHVKDEEQEEEHIVQVNGELPPPTDVRLNEKNQPQQTKQ